MFTSSLNKLKKKATADSDSARTGSLTESQKTPTENKIKTLFRPKVSKLNASLSKSTIEVDHNNELPKVTAM